MALTEIRYPYREGYDACLALKAMSANPFEPNTFAASEWDQGWMFAKGGEPWPEPDEGDDDPGCDCHPA